MKKPIYNIILLILAISITSCSNTESLYDGENISSQKSDSLTYWERISLLNDYKLPEKAVLESVERFDSLAAPADFRASSSEKLKTKIISKQGISLAGIDSRANNHVDDQEVIPIYYVEMNKGDKHGYALVSGDIRTSRILAFVPDTTSEKTYNQYHIVRFFKQACVNACLRQASRFNEFKDSLASVAHKKTAVQTRSDSQDVYDLFEIESQGWKLEWSSKKFPELSVTWAQLYPYNCKLPQKECTKPAYDYRCPAGCGVVAIAQALAYYEPKMSVYGEQVDWKLLKKQSKIPSTASTQLKKQIGFLMKWIGEKANATYTCDATYTGDVIGGVLNLVGMQCDKQRSFDWNTIFNSINNGHLVEVNGYGTVDGKEVGHSWIIDSYVIAKLDADLENIHEQENYVHCNFGWNGDENGYFLLEDEGVKFMYLDSKLSIHANIRKNK